MFSCGTLALKLLGADSTSVTPTYIKSNEKEVVFIPMHHVGTKEFYNSVYKITDSLGKAGYACYYEGLNPIEKDSIEKIRIRRKFRKIMGFSLTKSGYIDTINNTILGKYKVSDKYINQPKSSALISKNCQSKYNIDISSDSLLKRFELREYPIVLDSCDYSTSLEEKYNCNSLKDLDRGKYDIFKNEYILEFRNKHLSNYIQNSQERKIIVIYGKAHYEGFFEELKKLDPSWRKQKH